MIRKNPSYDRLSRWYRVLEIIAFGRDLERTRFHHLPVLAQRRHILLLGEGDGRCSMRVALLAPEAQITCVDSSQAMIDQARRHARRNNVLNRINFVCADARTFTGEGRAYDAVATLFFLDCFDEAGVRDLVKRTQALLTAEAVWLFADFSVPAGAIASMRAKLWLKLLFAFFRYETGLDVSRLPDSEGILAKEGWAPLSVVTYQHGLLRTAAMVRRSLTEVQGAIGEFPTRAS